MERALNIVIPMAGLSSRFNEQSKSIVKSMIKINGKPIIDLVLDTLNLPGEYIFILRRDTLFDDLEELLINKIKGCRIIKIEKLSQGPADSVLAASEFINNEHPLIIANSDQIMSWNAAEFLQFVQININLDGVVVTYNSFESHNSYAKLDDSGLVTHIKEKERISTNALNGIHYWRQGKLFVQSAKQMINLNERVNGEFYVAPTYNYLIRDGFSIGAYKLNDSQHFPVGTPYDLDKYRKIYDQI